MDFPAVFDDWMVNFILLISCRVKILENLKEKTRSSCIPETKAEWVVVCFPVALDWVWPKAISWVCPWLLFSVLLLKLPPVDVSEGLFTVPCTGHPSVCFIDFPRIFLCRKIDTVHYQFRCFDGNSHLPFSIEGYISHTPHLSFSSFLFFLSSAAQYMTNLVTFWLIRLAACDGLWYPNLCFQIWPCGGVRNSRVNPINFNLIGKLMIN